MDVVAHLTEPFLGPLGWAVLIVAAIFMALICFALQKKDRVRTGFWLRSCGFFLEAEGTNGRPMSGSASTLGKIASKH